jgi:putative membrane protein
MNLYIGRELQVKPGVVDHKETHFSWLRTRMSLERTLMSWVRTATALIGFGFTIFQFFERFNQTEGVAPARHPGSIRTLALALVGIGTGALVLAILEYRSTLRYLWSETFEPIAGFQEGRKVTPAVIVAIVLGFVGLFAFTAIAFRTAAG